MRSMFSQAGRHGRYVVAAVFVIAAAAALIAHEAIQHRQVRNSPVDASVEAVVAFASTNAPDGLDILARFNARPVIPLGRVADVRITWDVRHAPCEMVAAVHVSSDWMFKATTGDIVSAQKWNKIRSTRDQIDDTYEGVALQSATGSLDMLYALPGTAAEKTKAVRVLMVDGCNARKPALAAVTVGHGESSDLNVLLSNSGIGGHDITLTTTPAAAGKATVAVECSNANGQAMHLTISDTNGHRLLQTDSEGCDHGPYQVVLQITAHPDGLTVNIQSPPESQYAVLITE